MFKSFWPTQACAIPPTKPLSSPRLSKIAPPQWGGIKTPSKSPHSTTALVYPLTLSRITAKLTRPLSRLLVRGFARWVRSMLRLAWSRTIWWWACVSWNYWQWTRKCVCWLTKPSTCSMVLSMPAQVQDYNESGYHQQRHHHPNSTATG